MYQRVMQGPVAVKERARMTDLTRREQWLFIPLIALIFWIGVYPSRLLRRSEASVRAPLTLVLQATARVGVLLAHWLSGGYVARMRLDIGGYHGLVLVAALGAMLMAAGSDLIVVFLGLETRSIPLYVLAAFARTGP